jgi:hypothetical protein
MLVPNIRQAREVIPRVLDQMTDTAAADIARAEDLVGQALTAAPHSLVAWS